MSSYVTLSEVKEEDRDKLLEKSVTQNQLDRAEAYFESYVKDLGLTVAQIVTPVAFEVKEYIIARTFLETCYSGNFNNNYAIVDTVGETRDPYEAKKVQYKRLVSDNRKSLSVEVILQTDDEDYERTATPLVIGRG